MYPSIKMTNPIVLIMFTHILMHFAHPKSPDRSYF